MHPEKRAPSQKPRQQPLGAVVWIFISLCFVVAGMIFYHFPSALRSIGQASGGKQLLFEVLFYGLLQALGLWLVVAAAMLMRRHKWALSCTRGVLLFAMCFTSLLAIISFFLHDCDIVLLMIFSVNAITVGFLYCFIKKWNMIGTLLALAGIAGILFITNSPAGALNLIYASTIHVALFVFVLLYYFTHSTRMDELFPSKPGKVILRKRHSGVL